MQVVQTLYKDKFYQVEWDSTQGKYIAFEVQSPNTLIANFNVLCQEQQDAVKEAEEIVIA